MVNTRSNDTSLIRNLVPMETQIANLTSGLAQLTQMFQNLEGRLNNGEGPSQRRDNGGHNGANIGGTYGRLTKIGFPKFDGEGALYGVHINTGGIAKFVSDQAVVKLSKSKCSRTLRMLMTLFCNALRLGSTLTSTRPDIAFVVEKFSRYTSNPSALHWQALGYFDASWINNMEDHSSTSGWVFLLGGGATSWASKKQTCITSSTMDSEFVALAAAGNEAEWLRNLVYEIPLWPKPISTISIRCDSAATLAKAYSQVYNDGPVVMKLICGIRIVVIVSDEGQVFDVIRVGIVTDMAQLSQLRHQWLKTYITIEELEHALLKYGKNDDMDRKEVISEVDSNHEADKNFLRKEHEKS
nr:zinc finger, CCHC-type [Tanacetum cinerariifolium]